MVLSFAILREDIKTQNWKVLQILIGVNQKKKKNYLRMIVKLVEKQWAIGGGGRIYIYF